MTSRCHDLMIINQLVTSFIYLSIYVFVTEIKVLILLWLDTWWVCVCVSHSVMFNSFWPHGLWPASLLCPWSSPGKNTGVDSHSLLQGIFPTQGLNWISCTTDRFFAIWATREDLSILRILTKFPDEAGGLTGNKSAEWLSEGEGYMQDLVTLVPNCISFLVSYTFLDIFSYCSDFSILYYLCIF